MHRKNKSSNKKKSSKAKPTLTHDQRELLKSLFTDSELKTFDELKLVRSLEYITQHIKTVASLSMMMDPTFENHRRLWKTIHLVKNDPVKPSDIDFLNKVEQDETVFRLGRIMAAYIHGVILMSRGDNDGAARRFGKAILFGSQMTDEEKEVGFADKYIEAIKKYLDRLHGKQTSEDSDETREGENPFRILRPKMMLPPGCLVDKVLPEDLPLEVLDERGRVVKGGYCEGCKKDRTVGIVEQPVILKQCSRCRLAWYCSPQCQRAAWKDGHKLFCRVPYDFKKGDVVKLREGVVETIYLDRPGVKVKEMSFQEVIGLVREVSKMQGTIVEVMGTADPSDQSRGCETLWEIKGFAGTEPMNVKASDMTLIIAFEERGKLCYLSGLMICRSIGP
ncbi:hypothetical protein HDU76_002993, partial [Blyttiomyces sp. JEL0837]